MKNTLKVLAVFLTVGLLTTSCVEKSKKYQLLLAEKEAALVENQNIENEYNKEQCVYGKDSKKICGFCSAMCKERYEDFMKRKIKVEFIPVNKEK